MSIVINVDDIFATFASSWRSLRLKNKVKRCFAISTRHKRASLIAVLLLFLSCWSSNGHDKVKNSIMIRLQAFSM